MKFKQLAERYKISPKQNNGEWDSWLILESWSRDEFEMDHNWTTIMSVVAPDAGDEDEFPDLEGEEKAFAVYEYGRAVQVWSHKGRYKGIKQAEKEADIIRMLFGFYMDRVVNGVGSTGWDFVAGNYLAGLD